MNPFTNPKDKERLNDAIQKFEDQHDIEVLEIRPYGSHARNLDGPDSDWDIMFLFRQEPIDYVSELGNSVDSINTKEDGIDFQGWNIDKFGGLLKNSNPTAIEFLNSNPRIGHREGFSAYLSSLQTHANQNFRPIALYYHYRDMAINNYLKYLAETVHCDGERYMIQGETDDAWLVNVDEDFHEEDMNDPYDRREISKDNDRYEKGTTEQTVGRTLKVLRSVLYARHIRETHEFPSMDFTEFMSESDAIKAEDMEVATRLMMEKRRGNKSKVIGNPHRRLIEKEFRHQPDHEELNVRGIDKEAVNTLIRKTIEDDWWPPS